MDPTRPSSMGIPQVILQINRLDVQLLNISLEGERWFLLYPLGIVAEARWGTRGAALECQWNLANEGDEQFAPAHLFYDP